MTGSSDGPDSPGTPVAPIGASLAGAVVESSIDGLAVMDRETRYLLWNHAMERFAGKTAAEVLGRRMFEAFPFLRELGLDRAVERVLAGETVHTEGAEHVDPDGTRRVYDRVYMPLRMEGGAIEGVIAIVRDSTLGYAARDALRESEAKLRMAADAGGVGLWSWDPDTGVIDWEDAMCTLFGLPRGGGPKTFDEYVALIHPDDRARTVGRVLAWRDVETWEADYRIKRFDGVTRWVTSKARVLRSEGKVLVLGSAWDITDRRERDERQRAAQRLEVVGQLTAGIAHNFNNMLMGLLPNLELAARRAPPDLVPMLRDAQRSGQRAADLVRQLLTYAGRNRAPERRVEHLGLLVDRTVAFCRTTIDRRIAIDVRSDTAAAASVDATQVEQALLNLILNARDALDEANPAPHIIVVAEVVARGAPELEGREGPWVCLRVVDNGSGMDAVTQQHIYEPFFTTKEAGKGTGLGLATTLGIVRDHGGFLACASAQRSGTTMSIFLPGTQAAAPSAPVERKSSKPPSAGLAGRKTTVLVVDDDEPVRKVLQRVLVDVGFEVETAASGAEALERIADPEVAMRVSVVLLDVSMPGMSGPQLRVRLRDALPHARVAFLTGQSFDAGPGDLVLQKPITRDLLVMTLREILAPPAAD
ncbi:MAG: hybrid sensor histidine kinase/response regulator [Polyangiaceae bacterium]